MSNDRLKAVEAALDAVAGAEHKCWRGTKGWTIVRSTGAGMFESILQEATLHDLDVFVLGSKYGEGHAGPRD